MEIGRFKTRIENDNWETSLSKSEKQDLLFQNILIENDRIQGSLKMEDQEGTEPREKKFLIYKKGESFIIKTDFFATKSEELGIKFVKNDLLVFDTKAGVEITIYNKEAYN